MLSHEHFNLCPFIHGDWNYLLYMIFYFCNVMLKFFLLYKIFLGVFYAIFCCEKLLWSYQNHQVKKYSAWGFGAIWSLSCSFNYSFIFKKCNLEGTESSQYLRPLQSNPWKYTGGLWITSETAASLSLLSYSRKWSSPGVALLDISFGSRPKIYSLGHSKHLDTVY